MVLIRVFSFRFPLFLDRLFLHYLASGAKLVPSQIENCAGTTLPRWPTTPRYAAAAILLPFHLMLLLPLVGLLARLIVVSGFLLVRRLNQGQLGDPVHLIYFRRLMMMLFGRQ